jgi:hypothetical protein
VTKKLMPNPIALLRLGARSTRCIQQRFTERDAVSASGEGQRSFQAANR